MLRTTLKRLSSLVGLEATSTLQLKDVQGVSPLVPSQHLCISIHGANDQLQSPWSGYTGYAVGETIGLAPILRSGVGMEDALLSLLPGAPVYHLGLYR
jgi:uracil phosphoribosyltransferase